MTKTTPFRLCVICGAKFLKKAECSRKEWEKYHKCCSRKCSNIFKKSLSSWNKGMPRSWDSPSEFKRGMTPWNKGMIGYNEGEKNVAWKGDAVGREALHGWVKRRLGRPMLCSKCGFTSDNPRRIQWANKSGEYKRDLEDWFRLCTKCHKVYDLERIRERIRALLCLHCAEKVKGTRIELLNP